MSVVGHDTDPGVCVNHPRTETSLRCGKCGDLICTRCVVQTPVGGRCRSCAQLRRLPQFEVTLLVLLRASLAGLAASVVLWTILAYVPYLRFFLSIVVGLGVGEVVSRLAKRRSNIVLQVAAVADVVLGLAASIVWRAQSDIGSLGAALSTNAQLDLTLLIPVAIASYVALIKMR